METVKPFNRVIQFGQRYFWLFIWSFALILISTGIDRYRAYFIKDLFDDFSTQNINKVAIIVGAMSFATFFLKTLQELFTNRLMQRIIFDLRNSLCSKVLRMPLRFFSEKRAGDTISRLLNDVNSIEPVLTFFYEDLLKFTIQIVIAIGLMFLASPILAGITLVLFPLYVVPLLKVTSGLRRVKRRSLIFLGELTDTLVKIFSGIKTIKSLNTEEVEYNKFEGTNKGFFSKIMSGVKKRALGVNLVELFVAIGVVGLLAGGGFAVSEVTHDKLTPGDFALFAFACAMLSTPARELARSWTRLQEASPACQRVFEILDAEEDVQKGNLIDINSIDEVELADVTFAYDSTNVLANVSLSMKKGTVAAFVGRTGSGKSTLITLLCGLIQPGGGGVYVNKQNISGIRRASLLSKISVVTQETYLLNGTIRENLLYGCGTNPSEEQIISATDRAQLAGFLKQLPKGLETTIGEAGSMISGGERQRISIARAFLRNPDLYIFDEPTSALDAETEAKLADELIEHVKRESRILIMVSHRLAAIQKADVIYVLDNGLVVESGKHSELISKGGLYSKFVSSSQIES